MAEYFVLFRALNVIYVDLLIAAHKIFHIDICAKKND